MAENLNLKTVETVDTRPFRKLVMTIGELPTSFIESMTYYELLAWFTNYLETVIIPTVNNNGEAVEELQQKYLELKANTEQEIDTFENEITTAFNTLKNFVDNYFDNLDVQEEINNKLDEMAEQGILQEIITTYIQSNVAWTFDTVADMKLATNLVDGSFAQTLGFYSNNDKGGALYKITNTGTANEMDVIALGNSLYAHIVPQPNMNVKQFGAKGNGTNDDTNAIQTTLNYTKNVFIPSGTYMVNAITHISPNTGNKLTLDNDAIIKAITNAEEHYEIIYIDNVSNVEISGGTIEGDKSTHTGATGEWGQCISIINNSSNIYIHDITLTNSWGDGIYINTASGVRTQNLIINGARRNGISIVSASNYKSLNDTIINTGGTAPGSGIDIEPNYTSNVLKDIIINNLHTENNAGSALTVNVSSLDATQEISIKVFNHYDDGSNTGLTIYKSSTVDGEILIDKPYYLNSYNQGIKLRACYYGANACHINIYSPTIIGYNVADLNSTQNGSGISGFRTTTDPAGVIGNITIKNPVIKTTHTASSIRAIAITPAGDDGIEDVTIVDPIDLQGSTYVVGSGSNIKIYDKYKKLINTVTSNLNYVLNYIYSEFVNTKTASNHYIVTLNADIKPGVELKFTNYSSSYHFRIKIPTDQYCTQLHADAGPRIVLNNLGNSITLKKIDNTNWDVIDLNCTPTIEF